MEIQPHVVRSIMLELNHDYHCVISDPDGKSPWPEEEINRHITALLDAGWIIDASTGRDDGYHTTRYTIQDPSAIYLERFRMTAKGKRFVELTSRTECWEEVLDYIRRTDLTAPSLPILLELHIYVQQTMEESRRRVHTTARYIASARR